MYMNNDCAFEKDTYRPIVLCHRVKSTSCQSTNSKNTLNCLKLGSVLTLRFIANG